jgi:hypothetical protein
MQYISKGVLTTGSDNKKVCVNCRGAVHTLPEEAAKLWLNGQAEPQVVPEFTSALKSLEELGLIETADDNGALGRYRLLTGCIIVPLKPTRKRKKLDESERLVWQWIQYAGLRLTIAELICLAEKGIAPSPNMLGADNRQNLVEAIYSADTIADTVLESLMEKAAARDTAVTAVFGLLRNKLIMLV